MAELLASGYSDEAICTVFDQAFEESFNESITRQQITQARATYLADGGTFWTCRELQKSGVISPETCAKCGADKTTGFTKNDFGRYKKDGKYQFSRNKAASSLLREMHIEAKKNDKILRWFDGEIYQDTGESKIADTLYTTCQNYVNRGGVNEVIDRVRVNRQLCPAMFNQDPYIMPLQDQVIDLRTGEARPFRAEDLLTFKYEAKWDVDNADWKHFLWFLCSSLPDPLDVLTALDMVVAAAIRLPFNIMAQLIGGGSNGKGVYEKVMLAFYGEKRASALSLSELKQSRFGVGALFDVDLWIISEVEGVKDAINALKKIATGEFTDSDSKYGGRIKGRPHALTILDSNDAFDFGDDSYGRKRRTPKLDFCYTFGDEDGMRPIDEALEETLKTQESLAGIAKIVTARAPDLIASKRIFYTKSTEEREAGYARQRFSVKYFIDECIGEEAPSEGAVLITRKTDKQKIPDGGASLYDSYLEYCKLFHVPTPSNSNQLGAYIGKRFDISSKVTSHKGASVRLYPGLFLTKSPNEVYGDFVNNHLPTTPNYSRTTLKLQKGGIRIDIRKYFASENYSNYSSLMISVIEEIARMYSFISSRKDEKEIEYEKYLEFSVVSVVSVVDGRSIAVSCDGDCSSSVVSCDDTCSLGVTEDTNVEIDGPDKMPSTSKREMGIPVDMVNISRENGGRVSLADCERAGVMNAREKLDELVETEGWTTTTTKGGLITWTPPKMRVLSTIEDIKPFVETDGKTWALCRGDLMTTCPGISYTRAKALVKEGAARWVI